MSPKKRSRTATIMVAVLAVAAVALTVTAVALIGNDSDGDQPATDAHTHIDPVSDDPYVAATSTLSAILSYSPAEQETVFDQYAAVRDRLTGQLAQLADNPPTGEDAARQLPDQWDAWAESGDRVRAIVERTPDTEEIADDATEAVVTVEVREMIFHPDGETTPLRSPYVADATVVVEDDIWKLDSYEITSITENN